MLSWHFVLEFSWRFARIFVAIIDLPPSKWLAAIIIGIGRKTIQEYICETSASFNSIELFVHLLIVLKFVFIVLHVHTTDRRSYWYYFLTIWKIHFYWAKHAIACKVWIFLNALEKLACFQRGTRAVMPHTVSDEALMVCHQNVRVRLHEQLDCILKISGNLWNRNNCDESTAKSKLNRCTLGRFLKL